MRSHNRLVGWRLCLVVLFLMNKGITFLWQTVPGWISSLTAESLPVLSQGPFGFVPFPLIVCVLGGLLIGLYSKHTGIEPEDLNVVMAKVKETAVMITAILASFPWLRCCRCCSEEA